MKKERNYITAGAFYRLSKELMLKACDEITHSLHLPKVKSRKMYDVYDKWHAIEVKIGFEDMAFNDKFNGKIIDLFYGNRDIYSETDKDVAVKMKEILQSLLDEINDKIASHDREEENKWTS